MKKAYTYIITLVAIGALGYIFLGQPHAEPEAPRQLAAAPAFSSDKPSLIQRAAPAATTAPTKKTSTKKASTKAVTFVLNTSTGKIHLPNCSSVDQIKPKNKQDFYKSYNEIFQVKKYKDFKPCQRCHPETHQ